MVDKMEVKIFKTDKIVKVITKDRCDEYKDYIGYQIREACHNSTNSPIALVIDFKETSLMLNFNKITSIEISD